MDKVVNLVSVYTQKEGARKELLAYCENDCVWLPEQFVDEESFVICVKNFKREHPNVL